MNKLRSLFAAALVVALGAGYLGLNIAASLAKADDAATVTLSANASNTTSTTNFYNSAVLTAGYKNWVLSVNCPATTATSYQVSLQGSVDGSVYYTILQGGWVNGSVAASTSVVTTSVAQGNGIANSVSFKTYRLQCTTVNAPGSGTAYLTATAYGS